MRFPLLGLGVAAGVLLAPLVSGCANNASQLNPQAQQPLASLGHAGDLPRKFKAGISPDLSARGVYVSTINGHVFWYNKGNNEANNPPTCTVGAFNWSGNFGIASDKQGNVYVPESNGDIAVYAFKCGALLKTLVPSYNATQAAAVATDGNTAYGAYWQQTPAIQIFANGSTTATGSLSDASIQYAIGMATDAQHDVFLSYLNTSNAGAVIEFPGGTMPGEILGNITTSNPGGVLVDKAGNLLVIDIGAAVINIYAPPYTGSSTRTINVNGFALYCTLNHKNSHLFCTDLRAPSIDVYAYADGSYLYGYSNGIQSPELPLGIAL